MRSVVQGFGRTITVEIARQGGKNELSAQVELLLLTRACAVDIDAIKCAPTFAPQLRFSMRRLWARIVAGRPDARRPRGAANAIRIGRRAGAVPIGRIGRERRRPHGGLLLEVDEAQDVDTDKFDREFRPMAATTNATTVLYGTAWDDATLLERAKQANLEAERRDGVRRHFAVRLARRRRVQPGVTSASSSSERGAPRRDAPDVPDAVLPEARSPAAAGCSPRSSARSSPARTTACSHPAPGERYVAGLDLAGGDDALDCDTAGGDALCRDGVERIARRGERRLRAPARQHAS